MNQEEKYKFSIIIPCYKVEQYLHQCVDSVLVQTFEDYEVILVDDGSPDGCPAICDEYAIKDNRVKVIHKENGGLSDARNAGLDVAKGEYVMFLDSDDWWDDKNALRKLANCFEKTDADICIIGMKKYFQKQDIFGDERTPACDEASALSQAQAINKYMKNNIFVACACDKAVRKSFIETDKQRFVIGQYSEDIEWCCKLLLKNPMITTLTESFYVYRQQVSTSITANVGIKNIYSILDVITRYSNNGTPQPLLHFVANQYVLLITNFMRLSKMDQKQLDNDVKKFWRLIDYNWYPYVKLVSKVRYLGFHFTCKLLRIYYVYKNKKG